MKTLLIIDSSLGQARRPSRDTDAGCCGKKAGLSWVEKAADAELVIVAGSSAPADSTLNGKKSM